MGPRKPKKCSPVCRPAQGSRLKAKGSRRRAQSKRLKAQGSRLKAKGKKFKDKGWEAWKLGGYKA
jgi:hypothetical protein